jgi:hypothetical protein
MVELSGAAAEEARGLAAVELDALPRPVQLAKLAREVVDGKSGVASFVEAGSPVRFDGKLTVLNSA